MEEKTVFNLKLHEGLLIADGSIYILRVPRGWIYKIGSSLTFVPWSYPSNLLNE